MSRRELSEAVRYWLMAVQFARYEEPEPSGHLATAAMEMGLRPSQINDRDLWDMLYFHSQRYADHALAVRIADVLVSRGAAAESVAPYRDIALAWEPRDGTRVLDAARRIDARRVRGDEMVTAEGLTFGYQFFQLDKSPLDRAMEILRVMTVNSPDAVQTRARYYHLLAETQFYLGEKRKSVESTRMAVRLWGRPRWKVHLGARMCESGAGTLDEALKLIEEGLVEEPSYYSYQRAMVAMHAGMRTKQDLATLTELVEYVGETHSSIPGAQIEVGHWLAVSYGAIDRARPFVERGIDLYGGVRNAPQGNMLGWAAALTNSGREEEGWAAALSVVGSAGDAALRTYYLEVGEFDRAITFIKSVPKSARQSTYTVELGLALHDAGRDDEALAVLRQYVDEEEDHRVKYGRWNEQGSISQALVAIAEISGDRSAAERALAVLDEDLEMGATGQDLFGTFRARAEFVLGGRAAAIASIERYMAGPRNVGEVRYAQRVLARMRADTGGRGGSARAQGCRGSRRRGLRAALAAAP
jgi:tetratricopeptide (TPR) repeat protein